MKSWGCALLLSLAVAPSLAMSAESSSAAPGKASVYAHRGASALLPEHTLAAYAQAITDGADYIEPDLVMTKDGALVARHENEIGGTTDVASRAEFADRRTTRTIDGEKVEGWFTEDFTLAELKTLYARERLPQQRSTAFDGQFRIASFDEILAFLVQQAGRANRGIGLVPDFSGPMAKPQRMAALTAAAVLAVAEGWLWQREIILPLAIVAVTLGAAATPQAGA